MGKHLSKEEVIKELDTIYNGEFDFSDIEYINKTTKVKVHCKKHGDFFQTPKHLLNGIGCKECSYEKLRSNFGEFVNKASIIHNDKYTYTNYINSRTLCKIICPIHGEFEQTPTSHLSGCGCPKCGKREHLTTESFIKKAVEIHGDKYDYSNVDYIDSKTKIKITCPIHGEFEQTPNSHLKGYGCLECSKNDRWDNVEKFIKKASAIHKDKYSYDNVKYINSKTKVDVMCMKHGIFKIRPNDHLNGHGCPKCNQSHLEEQIANLLNKNEIEFKQSFRAPWLGLQHLDFYLPEYNVAIECQGEQHYEPCSFNGDNREEVLNENFERQKERDERKARLCAENNVRLIYFTDYKEINEEGVTFKNELNLIHYIVEK